MKRDDLKKLELSDDAIDAIMALHGKTIEAQKRTADTLTAELETVKGQLSEAGQAIESFKALKPDELKAAADEWKAKAEKATQDAEQMVNGLKFDYALKDALKTYKAKDPADVLPHLKRDTLKLSEDGQIVGLKEQIEPLKEAKDYLFASDEPEPRIVAGTGKPKSTVTDTAVMAAYKAAGLKLPGEE
jgi:hypothetical protein